MQMKGGPLDGNEVPEGKPDHLCIPLPTGRYASYHRQPWDGCVFEYDGNWHFGRIILREELQAVKDSYVP